MQKQLKKRTTALQPSLAKRMASELVLLGTTIGSKIKALVVQPFILAEPAGSAGAVSSSYINTRRESSGPVAAGYLMAAASFGTFSWYSPGFSVEDGERPFIPMTKI